MTTRNYDMQYRGTSPYPGDLVHFLLEPGQPSSFRPAIPGSAQAAVDELAKAMRPILSGRGGPGLRPADSVLAWTITIITTRDVKIGPAWRRISYLSTSTDNPFAVVSPFLIRNLKTAEGRAEIAEWLDDLVRESGWLA